MISFVYYCAYMKYDVHVCETENGRFSSGEKKCKLRLQSCVRAALHNAGVDASPVCGHVNFMTSIFLSNYLIINLAFCTCPILILAHNLLCVCLKKYSTLITLTKVYVALRRALKCSFPLWHSHWCIVFFLNFPMSNESQSFSPPFLFTLPLQFFHPVGPVYSAHL